MAWITWGMIGVASLLCIVLPRLAQARVTVRLAAAGAWCIAVAIYAPAALAFSRELSVPPDAACAPQWLPYTWYEPTAIFLLAGAGALSLIWAVALLRRRGQGDEAPPPDPPSGQWAHNFVSPQRTTPSSTRSPRRRYRVITAHKTRRQA